MKHWIGQICGLMCCLLVITGCFNLRPVEPPGTGNSDWVSPTDYPILLENLRNALAQGNTQNYLRCFNQENLQFQPAPSLLNDNESIWRNWSLQDEQAYFDNMLADLETSSGNSLSLIEQDLQDVSADSLRYVGAYTLRINHKDTALTQEFTGRMQLVMELNEFNEWAIRRWVDIEVNEDSSWSLLKLRYVQ
ncbi:MAG: hypothetical protein AAGI38_19355 [Bacteroidota bacterium]